MRRQKWISLPDIKHLLTSRNSQLIITISTTIIRVSTNKANTNTMVRKKQLRISHINVQDYYQYIISGHGGHGGVAHGGHHGHGQQQQQHPHGHYVQQQHQSNHQQHHQQHHGMHSGPNSRGPPTIPYTPVLRGPGIN
jgi:hypothetical protein